MLRKVLCAVTILAFAVGVGLAEEIRAVIIKIDGKNVTFAEYKGKGEKGSEKTMPLADNVKLTKGKFNQETKKLDAGDVLDAGLKNEVFTKIDAATGLRATIITDGDNKKITEIRVGGGGKKGK